MGKDVQRVRSVIAALMRVREHVALAGDTDDWDTEPYNRWVGMLEGSLTGTEAERLRISEQWLTSQEYLMNLDACIAFLENEEPSHANGATEVIEATYSEPEKARHSSIWPMRLHKTKES
ncbi:MAG: hypothetical protein NW216_01045 [Hyphomicrobium sp.]|nr:hypothetical protein [Hyphomicrobium sp.]